MSVHDYSTPIDVDLAQSKRGVWLVKMPKYLSQILNDFAAETVEGEVGRLIQRSPAVTGARSQNVVFSLNDHIMEKLKERNPSKDYRLPPKEHRFCLSNVFDGVIHTVLTRTSNNSNSPSGEQISLVGKVIQRAEVRPVENEQYMSMKRKQFEISQPKRRAILIPKKTNDYTPKRDHEQNKLDKKKKKLIGKRLRSSEDVVLNLMFEAFAKNQYISLIALLTITQQPRKFVQELVKRYCNYNNAGHNYELKAEFRHYTEPKEEDDMDDYE